MKEHFKSSLPSKRGKKLTQEEFLERARECHGNKYDYSKAIYTKATGKITIICPDHGEFVKVANDHIRGANCPMCAKASFKKKTVDSTEEFIQKANLKHDSKYDYSDTEYINSRTKVNIKCLKHGIFSKTPTNHLNGQGCPECSKENFVPVVRHIDAEQLKKNFVEKARKIHGDKYDYSKSEYVKNSVKIKILCPEHGEFIKIPSEHLIGSGCPQCLKNKPHKLTYTTEKYVSLAKKKYGDKYDYSKTNYKTSRDDITITCPNHGDFQKNAQHHLSGGGCPQCNGFKSSEKRDRYDGVHEFLIRSKDIHNNLYDYSEVNYVNSFTKIDIICPVHGKFEQVPYDHVRGAGCKTCAIDALKLINSYTHEQFIEKSNEIHNNLYDYSKTKYTKARNNVIIICKKHGEFSQKAGSHMYYGHGCPKCSMFGSKQEEEVKEYLNELGISHIENSRKIISPRELDVYIPELNVAIEMNGNYYHSELFGKSPEYHLEKTKECEDKGIQLIHVFESEWINNKELVKSMIKAKIGKNDKIFARKCKVSEISNSDKNDFLIDNHLQGKDNSAIRYGLYHEGELVSVMTFLKSRFNKKYEIELSRFASKQGVTVVGGASKLFKHFVKNHNPESVISYSNKRYSEGNLYKQLGFEHLHDSSPNYFYFKIGSPYELFSRQRFQKHKLKDVLDTFDPNKTEWENMKDNEYNRIWDCGNGVWGWNK